jgi:hypothetical protein
MDKESQVPGLYRNVVRRSPYSFQRNTKESDVPLLLEEGGGILLRQVPRHQWISSRLITPT